MLGWLSFTGLLAFLFLFLGFKQEDYGISVLSSFYLGFMGVWIIGNGIQEVNNNLTQGFGIMLIGISLYIIIRGGYELIKDLRWKGFRNLGENE